MDAEALEKYRQRLVQQRRELVESVLDVEGEQADIDADFGEEVERVDRAQRESFRLALDRLDDIARQELEDTEEALERIDKGDYGICIDCGRHIPRARLDAVPAASRCESCQEELEREESFDEERRGTRRRP